LADCVAGGGGACTPATGEPGVAAGDAGTGADAAGADRVAASAAAWPCGRGSAIPPATPPATGAGARNSRGCSAAASLSSCRRGSILSSSCRAGASAFAACARCRDGLSANTSGDPLGGRTGVAGGATAAGSGRFVESGVVMAGGTGACRGSGSRPTEIHTTRAVASAAAGTSHLAVRLRHHGRPSTSSSVRAIAARSAWQRTHPAACFSTVARASDGSAPSIHAASDSASTH